MVESIQAKEIKTSPVPFFLNSFWKRRLYGAFMVIVTFLDFQYVEVLRPDWQSGRVPDYINLFLSPEATLLFFPLIAYSIICFLLLMENQEQYAHMFVIRLGIYTGAFLALQYSLLTMSITSDAFPSSILLLLLIGASPFLVKKGYQWLSGKLSAVLIRNLTIGVLVIVLITMLVMWDLFFGLLIFLGLAAPFWSFLISGQTALWLFRNHESKITLFRGIGIVAWIATYAAALRFDILKMYELYAALPPQPPDCYIATAAAQGHPNIVRSQPVCLTNGKVMRVNAQLQHFKCMELAMMISLPEFHKSLRQIYDVLGRKLAGHLQDPLLADVAFLILLPVEWISFPLLKLFIPEIELISKKIYHS